MPQGWSFTRELTVQLLHSIYTVELKIYIYRLKWSEVIEPAIKLAKDGFSVTEHTGRDEKKKDIQTIIYNNFILQCCMEILSLAFMYSRTCVIPDLSFSYTTVNCKIGWALAIQL